MGCHVAVSDEELDELDITHIVSVLQYLPMYSSEDKYKMLCIRIKDTLHANILEHLETMTEFIKNALDENNMSTLTSSIHTYMLIARR